MKRVLITGASGFIGQHIVRVLCNHNYILRKAVRDGNKNDCAPDISIVGNIDGMTSWKKALRDVDIVIHLAARVHLLKDNTANPLYEFRKVNVNGSINLARQAAESGVKRLIFLSSVKVNCEQSSSGIPLTEASPLLPESAYGISKMEAEQGLLNIAKKTGLEVVILRPPLVYGPGVKGNFLNMMEWLIKGIPLPFGAINNNRSFVAVENLVNFLVLCLDHPAAVNQIFFVSDGKDLSTTELLRCLAKKMSCPSRLVPIPQRLLEISLKTIGRQDLVSKLCKSFQVDIRKAQTFLGWQPIITIESGLDNTAKWFMGHR